MSVIIEFFTTLGNSIVAVIEFTVNMFRDLAYLVKLFAELLPAMPAFWTWLPASVTTIIALTVTVYVILRIVGRSE